MKIELYGKLSSINTTEINMNDNQITTICPEISKLINLRTIYLSGNKITTICPEIGLLLIYSISI